MTTTLRLNFAQLQKLRKLARIDTNAALARQMNVDEATVSRVIQGKQAPGPKFMASLVTCFPGFGLDDLFEVVEKSN